MASEHYPLIEPLVRADLMGARRSRISAKAVGVALNLASETGAPLPTRPLSPPASALLADARPAGLAEVPCGISFERNISKAIVHSKQDHGHDHVVTAVHGQPVISRLVSGPVTSEVAAEAHRPAPFVR